MTAILFNQQLYHILFMQLLFYVTIEDLYNTGTVNE